MVLMIRFASIPWNSWLGSGLLRVLRRRLAAVAGPAAMASHAKRGFPSTGARKNHVVFGNVGWALGFALLSGRWATLHVNRGG